MSVISGSLGAVGAGSSFFIKEGDTFDYAVTGTFSASLVLEQSDSNGITWVAVKTITAAESNRVNVHYKSSKHGFYRFRCISYVSGTALYSLTDVQTSVDGVAPSGVGAKNGSTVTSVESGDDAVHKTVLTLESTPISVVSVTTGSGVGGTKVYDMPEGYVHIHGCTADLSLAVETEADFTDGTPEGDIGIGTVAPANADALGTDATDDNIGTSTAFTMSAYIDSDIAVPPEASLNIDGTSTPVDVYVNALVDAADIDDDTTTNILVSGTITILWSNLGDY